MHYFNETDISRLPHLFRINLVNSCSGYKSANLIGSESKGISNLAVFSSVIHLGSEPPLLGFVLRPTTVPRNTFENLKETGVYTINHIFSDIFERAHHTSAKYDRSISEFDVTGLEKEYKDDFEAPYVKGAPVQLGMQYLEEYRIKANNTLMVVGKVHHLYIRNGLLENDGFVNLSKGGIMAINGLDGYACPELRQRLGYQRPDPNRFQRTDPADLRGV